jgi:hypothetical protein
LIRTSLAVLCAAFALRPSIGVAQAEPPGDPTYRDEAVRALMARARAARARDVSGISSYEGVLREHIYVGLTALRFRRERGLFEQERVARVRWSDDGERAVQWLGARRAIPIVGADTRREKVRAEGEVGGAGEEVRAELRRDLPDELLGDADLSQFPLDPGGSRLVFGGDWALHPLADTADAYYRFSSGDTLRIRLPDREVRLYEVKVQPRHADFHLVAGSLWFDAETTSLVRASYRPARPFNLLMDEPEDAEDVPGFLQPVEAEINYITVEYSLHEFRFWLPRRFAAEGEARLGRLVHIPITVEWSVGDYIVNEAETDMPIDGPLPPGWSRHEERVEDEETGEVSYVTIIVPQPDSLLDSTRLSEDFGARSPTAFTDDEIDEMRGELEQLLPTYGRYRPHLAWGFDRGLLRYNRVEGLSAGSALSVPLGVTTSMTLEGRIGTGDREPNVGLSLERGPEDRRWTLSGYYQRLQPMAEETHPFSLPKSVGNLLLGTDHGQYYRATGASLAYRRAGKRVRWGLEAFHERQRGVEQTTDFFLLEPIRDYTAPSVLEAEPLDLTGGRTTLAWFSGVDPNGLILTGRLAAEAAGGDAVYQRLSATLSATHPLPLGLAGALELGAGALWGDDPVQRHLFLGGSESLRGFHTNALHGSSAWRGRAEIASGFAGARIGIFGDVGWAGPRADFRFDDPAASVGIGFSLLDGLVRADLAHAVRLGSGWKLHLYFDGLF